MRWLTVVRKEQEVKSQMMGSWGSRFLVRRGQGRTDRGTWGIGRIVVLLGCEGCWVLVVWVDGRVVGEGQRRLLRGVERRDWMLLVRWEEQRMSFGSVGRMVIAIQLMVEEEVDQSLIGNQQRGVDAG